MPGGGSVTIAKLVPALLCGGLAIAAATGNARADTRDDVLSAISRCNVIHDNRVWMDCVYGAQQPMRALLGLPPAPEYQQRLVPPPGAIPAPAMIAPPPVSAGRASAAPARAASQPVPVRRGRAGFLGNLFGENPPVADARMSSYRFEKSGAFVVELDNGQKWRQADVEAGTANWNKPASSYRVTVTQGAFGSFSLRTADNSRTFRVERAK
jgi:hypothetical protein